MKKELRTRVGMMAIEIHYLRKKLLRSEVHSIYSTERIRELELQISDLEYKLRG